MPRIWLDGSGRHLNETCDDLNWFTSFWQTEAQRLARKKKLEQIYTGRFGEADYAEIKRIRYWLEGKTNREELIAYLIDKAPYDV